MQYGHRIEVQCPTEDTLIRLAELLPDHIVSGFHVAVDFTTANQENAQTLARELSLTTTLRWRGHSKTGRSFDTFYAAARKVKPTITARKTRRNLAIYTRGSITHFEARYAGAMCSGRGIRHSADLLNRDPAAMIDKDFRFSAVSWKRVDKLIEQTARNTVRQAAAHAGPCQTVAAVEQQLRTKIFAAINQQKPLGDPDVAVQDMLDAHYLLRQAAIHLPLTFEPSEPTASRGA